MTEEAIQLALAFSGASLPESPLGSINRENNGRANKLDSQDRAFHDWYRFVLSYPRTWFETIWRILAWIAVIRFWTRFVAPGPRS